MKWVVLMLTCLAGFCWPQVLRARSPHSEIHEASLVCGKTHFFVRGVFIDTGFETLPLSQVMTARTGSTESAVNVDLRQIRMSYPLKLGGAKGLASFVSGWQCRKTPAGHVLVLSYYCPQDIRDDVPAAFCGVTGEWLRYVALDGSLLDQGFIIDDLRYNALRAKLGYHDKPPDQASDNNGSFIDFLR